MTTVAAGARAPPRGPASDQHQNHQSQIVREDNMTIINPTPTVKTANPPRIEGTEQAQQLERLGFLAWDVARRFHETGSDKFATAGYVFQGKDFDAAARADEAAYIVAVVLAYIAGELAETDLPTSCLDGTESKQFRKGYIAALDQVGTELLEAISNIG